MKLLLFLALLATGCFGQILLPISNEKAAASGGTSASRVQATTQSSTINCSPTCSVPVTSTGSGHLGVLVYYGQGSGIANTISSVSGGGTWVASGACHSNESSNATAADIAYTLSTSAGATSLSVTLGSNDGQSTFVFYEYSGGTFTLNGTCQTIINHAASANPTSPSITLASGTFNVIVTGLATSGIHFGTTTVTGTGWTTPYNGPEPATTPQSAADDALNVGPGTYQATFNGFSGGTAFGSSLLAFKSN